MTVFRIIQHKPCLVSLQAPSQQQLRIWPGGDSSMGQLSNSGSDSSYPQLLLHKPAATQHSRHFLGNIGGMMEPHHPHPIYGSHHSNGRQLRQQQQQQNQPQGQASQGQQGTALMPVSSPQMQDSIELSLTHHHHLGQSSIMQPPPSSLDSSQYGSSNLHLGLSAFRTRTVMAPQQPPSASQQQLPQAPASQDSMVAASGLGYIPPCYAGSNNNNNPPQGSVGVGAMLTGGPPPRGVGGAGGRPDSEESSMMAVCGSGSGSGQSAANS